MKHYTHIGQVDKILADGYMYISDNDSYEKYVINIAQHAPIENYNGEKLWEMGIGKDTPCLFNVSNGKISNIHFYPKKTLLVKFLVTLKKLSINLTNI